MKEIKESIAKVLKEQYKPFLESALNEISMLDPSKLKAFADLVEKEQIERLCQHKLNCKANVEGAKTFIRPGNKYTKVDIGNSGRFMIDNDGNIFGIKAYGQVHKGHRYGTLDTINDWYWGDYYPRPKENRKSAVVADLDTYIKKQGEPQEHPPLQEKKK